MHTQNGLSVNDSAPDTPGVPPSSFLSFLRANASVPGIVLTDHSREYQNRLICDCETMQA